MVSAWSATRIVKGFDVVASVGSTGVMHAPCSDVQCFDALTTHTHGEERLNAVIMDASTWEAVPGPRLYKRLNIVVSETMGWNEAPGCHVCGSLDEALDFLRGLGDAVRSAFVVGGKAIFGQALKHPRCKKVFLTVHGTMPQDGCVFSDMDAAGFYTQGHFKMGQHYVDLIVR